MLYVIIGWDVPDALERRASRRADHLARIEKLEHEGRLVLAGPMPAIDSPDPGPAGFDGSLIVAEFASLDEAETWARSDPYMEGGAWERIQVHPFRQVAP